MLIMKLATALLLIGFALPALSEQSLLDQGRAALSSDPERAAKLLEDAIKQDPNNAAAHHLLGEAYGAMAQKASFFSQPGLAKKTREEFERAVQLDPNLLDARMGLVQYYVMAPGFMGGDADKAQQQVDEMRKRDAFYGARAQAFIYSQQKKPDLARKVYTDLVQQQPSSPKAHYWYGVHLLTMEKNNKQAAVEFDSAVKADATYMPGWFQVGHMAALNGGDFARGEQALQKYLTYTPKQGEPSLARAHYWLGQIYEKQGKKSEARQNYTISLKLNANQQDVAEALKRVSS